MHKHAVKVEQKAAELGLDIAILTMPQSTRSAQEAAEACQCELGQIVKSLIFKKANSDNLVLLLIAGDRMADLEAAAVVVGAPLVKAEAKQVKATTGFTIGGVPPFGHDTQLDVFMDSALLQYDVVWAAAGMPNTVFSVAPKHLKEAIQARLLS